MAIVRPRLGYFRANGKLVIMLYSPEEEAARLAMRKRMPHVSLVPLLKAAREAEHRYRAWSASWGDPVC